MEKRELIDVPGEFVALRRTYCFLKCSDLAPLMPFSARRCHYIYEHAIAVELTTSRCHRDDLNLQHAAKKIEGESHRRPANLDDLGDGREQKVFLESCHYLR